MSYQDRLQRYEQEKKKLQQQNLSPEDYMRAIIKLANKWRVQLWKSVVKIVRIMTQREPTNRAVVALMGVILKVRLIPNDRQRKNNRNIKGLYEKT